MRELPELVVWTGPMWSGKSQALIRAMDRCRRQGKRIAAFKPIIDDRYSASDIVSHDGEVVPAMPVTSGTEILAVLADLDEPPDVVAIDEAFMLSGSADAALWLFEQGVTVLVASLDLSYCCEPFDEIAALLPHATRVEKMAAVCELCPAEARYTFRKDEGIELIAVGSDEAYAPRCWHHHPDASGSGDG